MRWASKAREHAVAVAEIAELDRTGTKGLKRTGLERQVGEALADDPGLVNPLIDDVQQQREGLLPGDRYSALQVKLARARDDFRHLQSQGARREKLVGRALLPPGDGAQQLSEVEAALDAKAVEILMLEEALIKYCAELVRAQRGGKDPSAPRLGQEEAQRMSLRYFGP